MSKGKVMCGLSVLGLALLLGAAPALRAEEGENAKAAKEAAKQAERDKKEAAEKEAKAAKEAAKKAEKEKEEAAKQAEKAKKEAEKKAKKDGGEQAAKAAEPRHYEGADNENPLVRFFTHTVGEPMRKGLHTGGDKMEKGLKSGANKINDAFTTSDEERAAKQK